MRIPRVYDNQSFAAGAEIELGAAASQHLGRALRMRPGDQVLLFNGEGGEYPAEIIEISKRHVRVRLGEMQAVAADPTLEVVVGQCLSRGERMDFAVQKSTELGVTEIAPLFSERCEVKLSAERQGKRIDHWQQVAISACEQSLRSRVPEIHPPANLLDWIDSVDADLKLVLHPEAPRALNDLPTPRRVALLIGPEGGLSDAEVDAAAAAGFLPMALGPRVLRTETAPVAALALLHYLWGDLA